MLGEVPVFCKNKLTGYLLLLKNLIVPKSCKFAIEVNKLIVFFNKKKH